MEPELEETAEEPAVITPKKLVRKRTTREKSEYWFVRIILVLGPVLISSYFSYREATHDAETDNKSLKKKASAGYVETVDGLKHLDEENKALHEHIEQLEKRLRTLEEGAGVRIRVRTTVEEEDGGSAGSAAASMPAPPEPLEIAPSLDMAAQKHL